MTLHSQEVEKGERFEFGKNWAAFLSVLDDDRIRSSEDALKEKLGVTSLAGKTFLDVGSGSGLSSLSARRLGARVHSFDYDPQSVACTRELRRRYFPDDPMWTVEQGSVLDKDYLGGLGTFDVVYSWGVLHHTGQMWQALENVVPLVSPGGTLFVAIYNDQGGASRRWTAIKKLYNRSPKPFKHLLVLGAGAYFAGRSTVGRLLRFQLPSPRRFSEERKNTRGMSAWYDLIDWVGGYPFEVAKPEQIFDFYRKHGFNLTALTTCGGGLGCNEYVFRRV